MALVPFQSELSGLSFQNGLYLGSRTQDNKRIERFPMNNELASQIFEFYYEKEPLIGACNEQRYALTFLGEMHIEWGGGDIQPVILSSANERDHLDALFKRALDFRDMFGMAPVKLTRRKSANGSSAAASQSSGSDDASKPRATRSDKPMITIPPFGTGKFVQEYDHVTMTTSVVYEVPRRKMSSNKQGNSAGRARDQTKGGADTQVKRYDVFIWPGHEPSYKSHRFRSRIGSVLPAFIKITELRENLHDADFRASHPTVFTQSKPDTRSLEELTEEEVLGLTGEDNPGLQEQLKYHRDRHRAIQSERMAMAVNNAARSGMSVGAGGSGMPGTRPGGSNPGAPVQRSTVDSATGLVVSATRNQTWDGAIQPLPQGEQMASLVIPQSTRDLATFEAKYAETVCLAMGIPYPYLAGNVGSQRMRGEADQLRNNVRSAVMKDRTDINLFFSWAYEKTHRSTDNEFMVNALLAADAREEVDASPEERSRLRTVRSNIQKIAAMPYRTRVVFSEDPLPKKLELPLLTMAVSAGALTQLELANLLRAELGVPSIDQSHELLRGAANANTAAATLDETNQMHQPTTGDASKNTKKRKASEDSTSASADGEKKKESSSAKGEDKSESGDTANSTTKSKDKAKKKDKDNDKDKKKDKDKDKGKGKKASKEPKPKKRRKEK